MRYIYIMSRDVTRNEDKYGDVAFLVTCYAKNCKLHFSVIVPNTIGAQTTAWANFDVLGLLMILNFVDATDSEVLGNFYQLRTMGVLFD